MKRNLFNAVTVLAVFALIFSGGGAVTAANLMANIYAPTFTGYQGYVTVSGSPYNGTGYFKFAVVNAAGNSSYWSNDGTSSGAGQPGASVSLAVTNGLFNVLLGDAGMTPMQATVFQSPDRLLRVWFSTTGAGGSFTQLIPDRKIASVPYAFIAEEAVNADMLNGLQSYEFALTNVVQRPGFNITSMWINNPGMVSDVAMGVDGLPLIAFNDMDTSALMVAHCDDLICSSYSLFMLDTDGSVGGSPSIAIGIDGTGLISYWDSGNNNLKTAHCEDILCSNADSVVTLDNSLDSVGNYSSIAIGADGRGLISYYDFTNGNLKVAHCANTICNSADIYIADANGSNYVGLDSSLAIGADGLGLIVHSDATANDLRVTHCSNIACSSFTTTALATTNWVGVDPAVTIGADGLGLISYYNFTDTDLIVAHCSNFNCDAATFSTVDTIASDFSSIAIGSDGLGLIAYYNKVDYDLRVAHCSNTLCSSSVLSTLDSSSGTVGTYPSLMIGADGLGFIVYYEPSNSDLKVAHLSNTLGTPYVRR